MKPHHLPNHERRAIILEQTFWNWIKYEATLIGPLPFKKSTSGCWVPDYSHPGVAARIRAEVDMVEDMNGRRA